MSERTPRKKPVKPKLSKSEAKRLDAQHIPHIKEAWESYHQAVLMLIDQGGDEMVIEENRNFSSYYYEAYLDLLIGTRKK